MADNIWSDEVWKARRRYESAKIEMEDAEQYLDWAQAELDRLEEKEANS